MSALALGLGGNSFPPLHCAAFPAVGSLSDVLPSLSDLDSFRATGLRFLLLLLLFLKPNSWRQKTETNQRDLEKLVVMKLIIDLGKIITSLK